MAPIANRMSTVPFMRHFTCVASKYTVVFPLNQADVSRRQSSVSSNANSRTPSQPEIRLRAARIHSRYWETQPVLPAARSSRRSNSSG